MDGLLADGRVVLADTVLALPGSETHLSPEDRQLCNRIEELLRQAALAPPLPGDLADQLGVTDEKFTEMTGIKVEATPATLFGMMSKWVTGGSKVYDIIDENSSYLPVLWDSGTLKPIPADAIPNRKCHTGSISGPGVGT